MEEVIEVHARVMRRHPEISPEDVGQAWASRIASAVRLDPRAGQIVVVGFDAKGRMLELVAVRRENGAPLVFHAMTPPSFKMLRETGLV